MRTLFQEKSKPDYSRLKREQPEEPLSTTKQAKALESSEAVKEQITETQEKIGQKIAENQEAVNKRMESAINEAQTGESLPELPELQTQAEQELGATQEAIKELGIKTKKELESTELDTSDKAEQAHIAIKQVFDVIHKLQDKKRSGQTAVGLSIIGDRQKYLSQTEENLKALTLPDYTDEKLKQAGPGELIQSIAEAGYRIVTQKDGEEIKKNIEELEYIKEDVTTAMANANRALDQIPNLGIYNSLIRALAESRALPTNLKEANKTTKEIKRLRTKLEKKGIAKTEQSQQIQQIIELKQQADLNQKSLEKTDDNLEYQESLLKERDKIEELIKIGATTEEEINEIKQAYKQATEELDKMIPEEIKIQAEKDLQEIQRAIEQMIALSSGSGYKAVLEAGIRNFKKLVGYDPAQSSKFKNGLVKAAELGIAAVAIFLVSHIAESSLFGGGEAEAMVSADTSKEYTPEKVEGLMKDLDYLKAEFGTNLPKYLQDFEQISDEKDFRAKALKFDKELYEESLKYSKKPIKFENMSEFALGILPEETIRRIIQETLPKNYLNAGNVERIFCATLEDINKEIEQKFGPSNRKSFDVAASFGDTPDSDQAPKTPGIIYIVRNKNTREYDQEIGRMLHVLFHEILHSKDFIRGMDSSIADRIKNITAVMKRIEEPDCYNDAYLRSITDFGVKIIEYPAIIVAQALQADPQNPELPEKDKILAQELIDDENFDFAKAYKLRHEIIDPLILKHILSSQPESYSQETIMIPELTVDILSRSIDNLHLESRATKATQLAKAESAFWNQFNDIMSSVDKLVEAKPEHKRTEEMISKKLAQSFVAQNQLEFFTQLLKKASKSKNPIFIAHQDNLAGIYKFVIDDLINANQDDTEKIKNELIPKLTQVVELFPKDSGLLKNLGNMYLRIGHNEQATDVWTKVWQNTDLINTLEELKSIENQQEFVRKSHRIREMPVQILVQIFQTAKSEKEFFDKYHQVMLKFESNQGENAETLKQLEHLKNMSLRQLLSELIDRQNFKDILNNLQTSNLPLIEQGRANENPNFLAHQNEFADIYYQLFLASKLYGYNTGELVENLLRFFPDDPRLLKAMGDIFYHQPGEKGLEQANNAYNRAIQNMEQSNNGAIAINNDIREVVELYQMSASALYKIGSKDMAIANALKAENLFAEFTTEQSKAYPDINGIRVDNCERIAKIYFEQENWQKAIEYYQKLKTFGSWSINVPSWDTKIKLAQEKLISTK